MEAGKFLLGALAGVAIGAVAGVLMAPDKGSETRRKLAQKGTDMAGGLKDKYSGLKNKYNDVVDGVAEKLDSMTGKSSGDMADAGQSGMGNTRAAGATAAGGR